MTAPSSSQIEDRNRLVIGDPSAALPYVIFGVLTTGLALWCGIRVWQANGELALPLDDSYIHLQYARSFAALSPFEYTPDAAPSPGTTSLLWPLVLSSTAALSAPSIPITLAWLLGFFCLALLAIETKRIGDQLLSPASAWLAALMLLGCGAFTWFAASGMEVIPFAWLLMRTARLTVELVSPRSGSSSPEVPTRRYLSELTLLGVLLPFARPEGALFAWGLALVMLTKRPAGWSLRALLLAVAPVLPALVFWAFTGSYSSTTAQAKWWPLNPYADGTLVATISYNIHLLLVTLLDGQGWSPMFLPRGYAWLGWLSLPAVLVVSVLKRSPATGLILTTLGLGIFIPTTYETFLVNRLRYLWPFAPIWILGLACQVELVGLAAQGFARRWAKAAGRAPLIGRAVGILAGGAVCLGLVSKLPESVDDLTESATAIQNQQVALGRWAASLPTDSRLGVNDTGAIAFFSHHRTFDVVGLTTLGEAQYWAAGAGSRFEHYEHLERDELPTHFIVYPEWFALNPLLGTRLTERYVDASILGGRLLVAHRANYSTLGSGALPIEFEDRDVQIVDELDVADLESEKAHAYDLDAYGLGWLGKQRNRIFVQPFAPNSDHSNTNTPEADQGGLERPSFAASTSLPRRRVDGGREGRTKESFMLGMRPGGRLCLRLASRTGATVQLEVDSLQTELQVPPSEWHEQEIALPDDLEPGRALVTLTSERPFAALHYWVLGS